MIENEIHNLLVRIEGAGSHAKRELALVKTKLEEAEMWAERAAAIDAAHRAAAGE